MSRGQIAKTNVEQKIKEIFGSDFIGIYDKKLYVWSTENGERVQIAISLTCPKVPVMSIETKTTGDYNFEDDVPNMVVAAGGFQPAEITEEERARVNDLIKKLGL